MNWNPGPGIQWTDRPAWRSTTVIYDRVAGPLNLQDCQKWTEPRPQSLLFEILVCRSFYCIKLRQPPHGVTIWLRFFCNGESRISQRWAPTPKGGGANLRFDQFFRKMHENEEILAQMGSIPGAPWCTTGIFLFC